MKNLVSFPHSASDRSPTAAIATHHISELTAQHFQEHYFRPGIPIIITGLLEQQDDWTLEFLCEHLGDVVLPVRQYGRDRYQQDKRTWPDMGSGVTLQALTFQDYGNLIRNGQAHAQDLYLARCSLKGTSLEQTPLLIQAEASLGLSVPVTPLNLWCGPAGHTSCLHYDPMDGTLMQLVGTKQLILFPPSQLYNLYPFSVLNHLIHGTKRRAVYSQLYPNHPDLETFPRFRDAMPYRIDVTLHPGDILFIPAGWWHEVTSVGEGLVCSVNRWWNVPWGRSLRTWSKWRAHLGSILGIPHVAKQLVSTLPNLHRGFHVRGIMQRF